jgi:uncharacterized PurR-regulated membrane protein YhhQ (DUF165 family)
LIRFRHAVKLSIVQLVNILLPVLVLVTLLGAIYLYSDAKLDSDPNLAWARELLASFSATLWRSDLVLPVAFFSINLTSRRYGYNYALAQLAIGLALCLIAGLTKPGNLGDWGITSPSVTSRNVASFTVAFTFASLFGIALFEAGRGPRWWLSPLLSSLGTSLLFAIIYYPAAFSGTQVDWFSSSVAHFVVFFTESVLLLIPYCLLRPAMRPIGGLNGY